MILSKDFINPKNILCEITIWRKLNVYHKNSPLMPSFAFCCLIRPTDIVKHYFSCLKNVKVSLQNKDKKMRLWA